MLPTYIDATTIRRWHIYDTLENAASILTYCASIIGATLGLWAILFLLFAI